MTTLKLKSLAFTSTPVYTNDISNMTSSQLRVELEDAIEDTNGGFGVLLVKDGDRIATEISFKRTVRIPDDGSSHDLPPDLGNFPIYSTDSFSEKMPPNLARKGGVFIPIWRK